MPESSPRVVVTGAAGYIGSRLVADLQASHPDWKVAALDNFYRGDVREIGDVVVEEVDIRDREAIEGVLDGADAVVHLAAISGVDDCEDDPDLAHDVNVLGTQRVAWSCRQTGAAMLFPFSMAVLGDPQEFPITVDHARDPLNWYGRTKSLSERAIEGYAAGAFPAIQFMISNLYGHHEIDGRRISKGTVINFFVERALAGEPLTVYEPGTQSRNFVHVSDVARALARGVEHALDLQAAGETGSRAYEVATEDVLSVRRVADVVQAAVAEQTGREPPIKLVENPRADETLVSEFAVDTTAIREELGWSPEWTVEDAVAQLVADGV
jgi:UDP-glucose 4-epimerase